MVVCRLFLWLALCLLVGWLLCFLLGCLVCVLFMYWFSGWLVGCFDVGLKWLPCWCVCPVWGLFAVCLLSCLLACARLLDDYSWCLLCFARDVVEL